MVGLQIQVMKIQCFKNCPVPIGFIHWLLQYDWASVSDPLIHFENFFKIAHFKLISSFVLCSPLLTQLKLSTVKYDFGWNEYYIWNSYIRYINTVYLYLL